MKLFLSPHNDDETLFGAYTLLRHHPLVLVCFDGRRRRGYVSSAERERETAAAMEILGCPFIQMHIPCDPPDWEALRDELIKYDPTNVWAPLPEDDGHSHHNGVGSLAMQLWPARTSYYATYTMFGGKTTLGDKVEPEEGWPELKRRALNCYRSQWSKPGTAPHFERDQDEYLT